MRVVFFLNTLHEHVSPADYEAWVREVDYPTARSLPSIIEYTVVRVEGPLEGDDPVPYQYIERVLISDLAAYRDDLKNPALSEFSRQWSSHVASSTALHGGMIE